MSTFQRLCEALNRNDRNEEASISVLKSQPKDFWQQLARIASGGNIEGLSKLLNIPPGQIVKWPRLIKVALEELEDREVENKKQVMLPTGRGENG